ncbi:MAG: outer membrane beta-barrel protein [Verrucomicrobiota bacterium]|jgi:hypothetical protein
MKLNKWTLGLAAVGVVSLASAARADEKMNSLQTALSNTTISGYVSASFNWAITPGDYQDSPAGYIPFQGVTKENGFNLDVVKLSIAKPQDESPWASGYQIDLLFGPDAVNYNPSANGNRYYYDYYGYGGQDFAIKQAYVSLRTPIGNGIDWKVGVFDTIIGYEVFDAGSNPNYTRSWGYWVEPTEHTGVLGTYKINDEWSVSAGIANTSMAGINLRAWDYKSPGTTYYTRDWNKTFMGSVTFTAPSNWGWAAGSSFYAGIVYGFNGSGGNWGNTGYYANGDQVNYYAGATLNTPWKQLTAGVALDYVHNLGGGGTAGFDRWWNDDAVLGLYATYKATDKLSFNGRAEYIHGQFYEDVGNTHNGYSSEAFEVTGTMEYDLWANVISRLELRWDRFGSFTTPQAIEGYRLYTGDGFNSPNSVENKYSVGLYANVIYKF